MRSTMNNNDRRYHQQSYNHQQIPTNNLQNNNIPNNFTNNSTISHNVNPSIQPVKNTATTPQSNQLKSVSTNVNVIPQHIQRQSAPPGLTQMPVNVINVMNQQKPRSMTEVVMVPPNLSTVVSDPNFQPILLNVKETSGINFLTLNRHHDNTAESIVIDGNNSNCITLAKHLIETHFKQQQKLLIASSKLLEIQTNLYLAQGELASGMIVEFVVKPELLGYVIGTKGNRIKEAKESTGITNVQIEDSTGKIKIMGPDNMSVQKAKEFLDIDEEKHQITSAQINYLNRTRDEVINDIRANCKLIVARIDRQIEAIVFIGPRESLKIAGTLLFTELKYIDQIIHMDEEMRSKKMELATIKNQPFGGNHPNETKTQKNTRFSPQYISNWKAKNTAKNNDTDEPSNVVSEGNNNNNRRRNNSKFKDKDVESSIAVSEAPVKISNNSKVNSAVSASEIVDATSRPNKNKSSVIVKPTSDLFPNRRQSATITSNVTTSVLNKDDNKDHNTSRQQYNHSSNDNRSTNRKKSNNLASQDDIAVTASKLKPLQTSKETIYVTVDTTKNQNLAENDKKIPKESTEDNLNSSSIRRRLNKPSKLKSDENVSNSNVSRKDNIDQKVDNQTIDNKSVGNSKIDIQKVNLDSIAEGSVAIEDKSAEKQVEKPLEKRSRNRRFPNKNDVRSNDSNDKSNAQIDELSQSFDELAHQEVKT
eukprot:gene21575-27934_t